VSVRSREQSIIVTTSETIAGELDGRAAPITIVVADDHAIVRSALRRVLQTKEGFEVVGEAGDVRAAVRKVRGHKPDVLVLDLSMAGGSSLEAIPLLVEASPSTAIVVLTMNDEPDLARAALRAGALAFTLKKAEDTELEEAVRAVLKGRRYLNPQLGARIATEPEAKHRGADGLSGRERQVLRLLALGYTNAEIAQELYLSLRTVESHRSRIQHKASQRSRADLAAYARELGLV
jgi:two-component system, NarL family, response regulator NreC